MWCDFQNGIPFLYRLYLIEMGCQNEKRLERDTMQKEKVLYIHSGKYFESSVFDWYETFKSACKKASCIL